MKCHSNTSCKNKRASPLSFITPTVHLFLMNKLLNALTVLLKVISFCGSFSHATTRCGRFFAQWAFSAFELNIYIKILFKNCARILGVWVNHLSNTYRYDHIVSILDQIRVLSWAPVPGQDAYLIQDWNYMVIPICITQEVHPHTRHMSTILEQDFDVEISSSTHHHANYIVQS